MTEEVSLRQIEPGGRVRRESQRFVAFIGGRLYVYLTNAEGQVYERGFKTLTGADRIRFPSEAVG